MYFHLELRGPRAGELSHLLGKHPDRLFEWEVHGSMVRVFFPIYAPDHARVVVIYWPDPLGVNPRLSRHSKKLESVSPRPYAINSLFCSAMKVAFKSALSGHREAAERSARPEQHLQLLLSPINTYLSQERLVSLFEPLGYEVSVRALPSPEVEFPIRHPRVFELGLEGRADVVDTLRHLMVMILVVDSDRHEFMNNADVERLRRLGDGWLDTHPERTFIISRYLVYRRLIDIYVRSPGRGSLPTGGADVDDGYDATGEPLPKRLSPETQRDALLLKVLGALPERPGRLVQVGCGDGRFTADLVSSGMFEEVIALDASPDCLERTRRRIERSVRYVSALETRPTRYDLMVSALGYRDSRLRGVDAVLIAGVLEHTRATKGLSVLSPILDDWLPRHLVLSIPNRTWYASLPERDGRKNSFQTELDFEELDTVCHGLIEGRPYRYEIQKLDDGPTEEETPYLLAVLSLTGDPS